jgi:outer membrane protein assembly factor BamD (BamD/ComL family)
MLATLRAQESLGPAWDQATTLEAADHWRTLADQFPNDARAKGAIEQIAVLRDRAARARLSLARFYFFNRNNPEAAKLMANACRNIAPESAAAKEAEALLAAMIKDPVPPKTLADRLLGVVPRPRTAAETKPQAVGEDLDTLGFKKEPSKGAVGPESR